ncbi:hypothetical protein VI08_05160 [Luteibacter yeojuensis]|uniref:Fido domain-containing protein n=2 Tax=Luteibacter yeojuensis TaxID=345309 RepID=A0A0F3KYY8_9GAMM|nr:hypothetical protein VI08_05160 [Luteibacter yeojuensis]
MLAICNIHPFVDGNGRAARWLFNTIILGGTTPPQRTLPLYEYFHRDGGTSTLLFRTVELSGDWDPLFAYIAAILDEMAYRRSLANAWL